MTECLKINCEVHFLTHEAILKKKNVLFSLCIYVTVESFKRCLLPCLCHVLFYIKINPLTTTIHSSKSKVLLKFINVTTAYITKSENLLYTVRNNLIYLKFYYSQNVLDI